MKSKNIPYKFHTPKDELIELYYRRVVSMENKIQELETKLINYDRKN